MTSSLLISDLKQGKLQDPDEEDEGDTTFHRQQVLGMTDDLQGIACGLGSEIWKDEFCFKTYVFPFLCTSLYKDTLNQVLSSTVPITFVNR